MSETATLKLLPRKEFEITLIDGAIIKGKFGTWALRRFCDIIKVEPEDLLEKFKTLKAGDIFQFILSAVEDKCNLARIPFDYKDFDAADWIDQLGGPDSELFVSLINHASDPQKKTETQTPQEQPV